MTFNHQGRVRAVVPCCCAVSRYVFLQLTNAVRLYESLQCILFARQKALQCPKECPSLQQRRSWGYYHEKRIATHSLD